MDLYHDILNENFDNDSLLDFSSSIAARLVREFKIGDQVILTLNDGKKKEFFVSKTLGDMIGITESADSKMSIIIPKRIIKEDNSFVIESDANELDDEPGEKEYLGNTEETHYYLVRDMDASNVVKDLLIVDQDENKLFSAKDNQMEIKDVPAFIDIAAEKVGIEDVYRTIFKKYYIPKYLKQEEDEKEDKKPEDQQTDKEQDKESENKENTPAEPEDTENKQETSTEDKSDVFSKDELDKINQEVNAGTKESRVNEKIVKVGDKWQVQSHSGRNMGTYDTEEEAKDRLKQVEYFKHKANESVLKTPLLGVNGEVDAEAGEQVEILKRVGTMVTFKTKAGKTYTVDASEYLSESFAIISENDIFKPAAKEEIEARQVAYRDIKIKDIAEELKKHGTLNPDGTMDFKDDVNISKLGLTSIGELGIKFGIVTGNFYCSHNQLTTLEGGPTRVGRYFDCYHNQLTTLKGGPTRVGGNFYCSNNRLTTLKGGPTRVGGSFYCSYNRLTTLEGGPTRVGGSFYCSYNRLTTLEGAPKEVGGDFNCYSNKSKFTEEQVREVSKVSGDIVV